MYINYCGDTQIHETNTHGKWLLLFFYSSTNGDTYSLFVYINKKDIRGKKTIWKNNNISLEKKPTATNTFKVCIYVEVVHKMYFREVYLCWVHTYTVWKCVGWVLSVSFDRKRKHLRSWRFQRAKNIWKFRSVEFGSPRWKNHCLFPETCILHVDSRVSTMSFSHLQINQWRMEKE